MNKPGQLALSTKNCTSKLKPVKKMRPNLVAGIVLFSSSICWGGDWEVKDGDIAHAVKILSSDGVPATLEVRCRPDPEVRLIHPVLASMPTDGNGLLDWYQGAHINTGWGLDLNQPNHHGHLGLWKHCIDRLDCIHPYRPSPEWFIKDLRKSWSVFIRISPPDSDVVDLRISLVGSAKAIDAVCAPLSIDE